LDLWLFGHPKDSLVGWTFDKPEELLEGITSVLEELQPSELQVIFSHWANRVRWILENNRVSSHE
jgi:hypothetical protein